MTVGGARRSEKHFVSTRDPEHLDLVVVLPVYEDAGPMNRVVAELDRAFQGKGLRIGVAVVDDGSTDPVALSVPAEPFECIVEITRVRLRDNLGHQRAITVGLGHVRENLPANAYLVMDADGQDEPNDAPRLWDRLQQIDGRAIVFAERKSRSEGILFRMCYQGYRILMRVLAGVTVKFGNFSIIPHEQLERLMVSSQMWNHYVAAVVHARLPYEMIPTQRGARRSGHSMMGLVQLVMHGLSGMSVFSAAVGVRLLVGSVVLLLAVLVCVLLPFIARFALGPSPQTEEVYLVGLILLFLSQTVLLSLSFVLSVLRDRDKPKFLPIRDCPFFIQTVDRLYPPED